MSARIAVNHACPIRDVLDRVGDAWSLLVLLELSKGPCRFNALRRVIDGISQRMLSVTLRHLERDSLHHPQGAAACAAAGGIYDHRSGYRPRRRDRGAAPLGAVDHQPAVRAARAPTMTRGPRRWQPYAFPASPPRNSFMSALRYSPDNLAELPMSSPRPFPLSPPRKRGTRGGRSPLARG